jgi:hypothetical protein
MSLWRVMWFGLAQPFFFLDAGPVDESVQHAHAPHVSRALWFALCVSKLCLAAGAQM